MKKQWFEDYFDEIYLETNKALLSPTRTLAEVNFIIKKLDLLSKKKRILDVGCGYGRHLIEISRKINKNSLLWGMDISKVLLDVAREEAKKEGKNISWIHSDMRKSSAYPLQMDAIFCMFGTFGYFNDKDNLRVLKNISRALKPGGLFLLEIPNFHKHIKFFSPCDTSSLTLIGGEKVFIVDERKLLLSENAIEVFRKFIYPNRKLVIERFLRIRYYTIPEINGLLRKAGMKISDISGDLNFSPPTLDSNKLYILAVKHK